MNISLEQTEKGLRVTINDDGCGLPSGFTIQGQTSMGLTLMRTLVEDDLRSELEEVATPIGACFTFEIPNSILNEQPQTPEEEQ